MNNSWLLTLLTLSLAPINKCLSPRHRELCVPAATLHVGKRTLAAGSASQNLNCPSAKTKQDCVSTGLCLVEDLAVTVDIKP